MRKLPPSAAIQTYVLDLVYLHARLAANPATEAHAAAVNAQIGRLDAVKATIELAEREQAKAMARRDHQDDWLDDRIRRASKVAELHFGNRASPEFQRAFTAPAGEVVRLPIEEEVREAKILAGKLATSGHAELAAIGAEIDAGADRLEAAEQEWRASYRPVAVAAGDRDFEKANTNLLRDKTYGQLIATFPGDRARAESFFRETRTRASAASEPEVEDKPTT